MNSFYVVLSIVSGFSVGVSYSVRLMIPAVLAMVALVSVAQPALVADEPILVADATVLVALQEIAALIGLGLRLAVTDRRAAKAARRAAKPTAAAPKSAAESMPEIILPLPPAPRVWGSPRRAAVAVIDPRRRPTPPHANAQMARTYESFTIF